MKKLLLVLSIFVLCGCEKGNINVQKNENVTVEVNNQRFSVKSYGKFNAGHNDNIREICIITDSQTKKEYIAVTGCGVTEMVKAGKSKSEE